MRADQLLTVITIVNVFAVISFFVYFPIVYLNITFTSTFLTIADIPYYAGASTNFIYNPDRYQYQWFEFATDILRIAPPIMASQAHASRTMSLARGKSAGGFYWIYQIGIIALIILEVVKIVMRGFVEWFFCALDAFCHSFDPSLTTANYAFLTAFWMGFFYLLIFFVYAWLINSTKRMTLSKGHKSGTSSRQLRSMSKRRYVTMDE